MSGPLAIIQARLKSTRLPEKMLLPLGGKVLLRWTWEAAVEALGKENVVIACPAADRERLQTAVPEAEIFGWDGPEGDVLGRLAACAREYRGTTGTVLRVTPEDWPPVLWRDVTTVETLLELQAGVEDPVAREHVGDLLHLPRLQLEINTPDDFAAAQRQVGDVQ